MAENKHRTIAYVDVGVALWPPAKWAKQEQKLNIPEP